MYRLLTNQELMKSSDTLTNDMLKQFTELIINDFSKVRGTEIHPLDPNDVSLEEKKKLIPSPLKQLLTLT